MGTLLKSKEGDNGEEALKQEGEAREAESRAAKRWKKQNTGVRVREQGRNH